MSADVSAPATDAKVAEDLRNLVIYRGQSRQIPGANRRETPSEVHDRVFREHRRKFAGMPNVLRLIDRIEHSVREYKILGSQRGQWAAGEVSQRNNIAWFNCAALVIDNPRAYGETLRILMEGTGVGVSVESAFIGDFPKPMFAIKGPSAVHVIEDSTAGWQEAVDLATFNALLGIRLEFDYSRIRPRGTPLKTKGGYASGPEPLGELLTLIQDTILKAGDENRQLTSVEHADIICKCGEITEVGGTRRAALLIMFAHDDAKMAHYKHGPWGSYPSFRSQANISWTWREDTPPPREVFDAHWEALRTSGTGEPGIITTHRYHKRIERHEEKSPDIGDWVIVFNPCVEIALVARRTGARDLDRWYQLIAWRDSNFPNEAMTMAILNRRKIFLTGGGQFCNLSSVAVPSLEEGQDTRKYFHNLRCRVEHAATLGRLQAEYTDFHGLREGWKQATEIDRLVGVSLSGVNNAPWLNDEHFARLKDTAVMGARIATFDLIEDYGCFQPEPAAVTCGKPDGTTECITGGIGGMKAWHAPYFVRRISESARNPIAKLLIAAGVPKIPKRKDQEHLPENEVTEWLFEFPRAAPHGARIAGHNWGTTESLDLYYRLVRHYADHNVSNTNNIHGADEWDAAKEKVWANFLDTSGITFYPKDDNHYYGQPYEEIDEAEYRSRMAHFPHIPWETLPLYEDGTESRGASGCEGASCEIRG